MEKTKITKKEYFNAIIEIATENGRQDIVDFATHEIELLNKKASYKGQTKVQEANEQIKNVIVATLTELARFVTITELQTANEELAQLSNQKISALLKQLVDTGIINKQVDKKKAYFGM
jgi:DNA-binding transcriptional regulator GbsR (MarR family)